MIRDQSIPEPANRLLSRQMVSPGIGRYCLMISMLAYRYVPVPATAGKRMGSTTDPFDAHGIQHVDAIGRGAGDAWRASSCCGQREVAARGHAGSPPWPVSGVIPLVRLATPDPVLWPNPRSSARYQTIPFSCVSGRSQITTRPNRRLLTSLLTTRPIALPCKWNRMDGGQCRLTSGA
jgi:hypothetical protein